MKFFFTLTLALLMLFSLVACSGKGFENSGNTYELALVTDIGGIDDKGYNQGIWEGILRYAQEKDISHQYYQSAERSDDACLAAIDLAVKGGAKVIVASGSLFEVPIYIAQERYPNVYFILVDGTPHDAENSGFSLNSNVVSIQYAEEQAGFLAGYAAVRDGNTRLGFMGGMEVPSVVRFGYGYVQGADCAAREMGFGEGGILINYYYTGDFVASPEAEEMAASWYDDGIDVIFGCGGAVGSSVIAAAEAADKKVIGADIDQSGESATVITSAMKNFEAPVYACISDYYAGRYFGGQIQIFNAGHESVGLPMETSRFEMFTKDDYDAVFNDLYFGEITIENSTDISVKQLPTLAVIVVEY